jgi:aspartate-semialdehyde dehydrogenase
MSPRVAILGATGLVGRAILALLEERGFPVGSLTLLASGRADERHLTFKNTPVPVRPVSEDAFQGVDYAWFASANDVSEQWAPVANRAGARVVDNSSAFRYVP